MKQRIHKLTRNSKTAQRMLIRFTDLDNCTLGRRGLRGNFMQMFQQLCCHALCVGAVQQESNTLAISCQAQQRTTGGKISQVTFA